MKKEFRFDDVDTSVNFDEPALDLSLDKPTVNDEEANLPASKTKAKAKDPKAEVEKDDISDELKAKYLAAYDSIMFEDKYEEEVKLGKKYAVVFSTRSADADLQITRQLDAMDFQTISAYQTMATMLTMSHSLVCFNGTDLSELKVSQRYDYLKAKSSHLIEMLSKHMIEFDATVREALVYGEGNF